MKGLEHNSSNEPLVKVSAEVINETFNYETENEWKIEVFGGRVNWGNAKVDLQPTELDMTMQHRWR